jgi:hypothetical protein
MSMRYSHTFAMAFGLHMQAGRTFFEGHCARIKFCSVVVYVAAGAIFTTHLLAPDI